MKISVDNKTSDSNEIAEITGKVVRNLITVYDEEYQSIVIFFMDGSSITIEN